MDASETVDRFTISDRDARNVLDTDTGLIAGFTSVERAAETRTLLKYGDAMTEDFAWWAEVSS